MLPDELPGAIERLQAEAKDQKRASSALQARAGALSRRGARRGAERIQLRGDAGRRWSLRAIDADANGLKALASAIVGQAGYVVVLVSTSTPALVVVARSADVDVVGAADPAALIAKFGGRGGGKAGARAGRRPRRAADAISRRRADDRSADAYADRAGTAFSRPSIDAVAVPHDV